MKQTRSFVGMDVHKATISNSVAEDGRSGSVRFIGVIDKNKEVERPDAENATDVERPQVYVTCCRLLSPAAT